MPHPVTLTQCFHKWKLYSFGIYNVLRPALDIHSIQPLYLFIFNFLTIFFTARDFFLVEVISQHPTATSRHYLPTPIQHFPPFAFRAMHTHDVVHLQEFGLPQNRRIHTFYQWVEDSQMRSFRIWVTEAKQEDIQNETSKGHFYGTKFFVIYIQGQK